VLNAFHFAVYGVSAAVMCAMVAPSWHYGFFFTPFPALLTFLLIGNTIAAAVSARDMIKPVSWLGEPMPLNIRRKNLLRELALIASAMACFYVAFSSEVKCKFNGSTESVAAAQTLISIDGVLFGSKRAEQRMWKFADKAERMHQHATAALFLNECISSLTAHHHDEEDIARVTAELAENNICGRHCDHTETVSAH
jgi:hypothetical protein